MPSKSLQDHDNQEKAQMKLITLYVPETYIKALDQLVDARFYPNRAEAIRAGIRDLLAAEGRFQAETDYKPPHQRELTVVENTVAEQSRKAPRRFQL